MSDYYHRSKLFDSDCPRCESGTVTGSHRAVSCDECTFRF